jgi:DNA modification methylase
MQNELQIEYRELDSLIPYAKNARTHSDEQVLKIAGSIKAFGWTNPILVDGENGVIAGHGRIAAARKLGMSMVPVIELAGMSENQKRAYIITDNRTAELAGWDNELLALELCDLAALDFDIELTGFTLGDLELMMPDKPETEGDTEPQIDRAEELREQWGVETGHLWQLGEHRILCGDSTNAEDVDRVMGGGKADAVLTDPPYGQNQEGVNGDEHDRHTKLMGDAVKQMPIENGVVIAFQSPRTFHAWTDAMRKEGFNFERMLWMYKAAQCTFPWRGWILKSESIPVCSKGNANWQEIHPFSHDCYYLSEVSNELKGDIGWHGSVKPMSVVSDLLSRISSKAQLIYEPFSGSGTTIIACENLGRKCRAIEISPGYVAVALQRWADHTGKTPILIECEPA